MELLQDGVIAALFREAKGLFWYDRYKPLFESAINLAASLLLWRERPVDAVYLVRVSGDGTGLDVTLRRLAQSRRLPVLLVDCGLTDEGRRAAALLSDMNTKLLTPQELAAYYTEEDTTEQGR